MEKTKLRAILILIAAFLLGSVAGYSVSHLVGERESDGRDKAQRGGMSAYLKERLRMDDDQIAEFDVILTERREAMNEIHSECRLLFDTQIDSMRHEIRSILNEEQLAEYERFLEEFDKNLQDKEKNKRSKK